MSVVRLLLLGCLLAVLGGGREVGGVAGVAGMIETVDATGTAGTAVGAAALSPAQTQESEQEQARAQTQGEGEIQEQGQEQEQDQTQTQTQTQGQTQIKGQKSRQRRVNRQMAAQRGRLAAAFTHYCAHFGCSDLMPLPLPLPTSMPKVPMPTSLAGARSGLGPGAGAVPASASGAGSLYPVTVHPTTVYPVSPASLGGNSTYISMLDALTRCARLEYLPRQLSRSQISWRTTQAQEEQVHPYLLFGMLLPRHPFSQEVSSALQQVGPMFPQIAIVV
ncbi:hypothetical protein B484DRAFT_430459, partial [Ochromonadaceae sp. CCMP2298]